MPRRQAASSTAASKSRWCPSRRARRIARSKKAGRGPGQYTKSDWDTWIEDQGVVVHLLNDDDDDAPHQRFVIRLASSQTLLVAHNVDIAERVPVGIGDRVAFRGLYEWNPQGGVVHWTHRDPQGGEEEGFVRFRDRVFS